MANSLQARKRARQNNTHRQRNASRRSALRTYIRRVNDAIEDSNYEAASTALVAAVPVIDKAAGNGLIHKNKAARHKRRLTAKVKALQPQPA